MKKRTFITTVFAASMLKTAKGCFLYVYNDEYKTDQLKGIDFISALTSEPLARTLQDNGIKARVDQDVKITLQKGDEVYIVNPNIKLHKIKGEKLPPYASITATRVKVMELPEISKDLED